MAKRCKEIALAIKITGWQGHKRPEGTRLRTLRNVIGHNLQSAQADFVNLPAREFIRQGSEGLLFPFALP